MHALTLATDLINKVVRQHGPGHELIIASGFNPHDQVWGWGGDEVGAAARQGEAGPIVDMMVALDLQSLLPRGTKTYEWSGGESTTDLVFASSKWQ